MTIAEQLRPRWFSVGHSRDADSATAGARAAGDALANEDPKLVVVFCSDCYDLPVLLEAIVRRAEGAAVIGCSTAGEIATAGASDAGVVVVALGGDGFSVSTAVARNAAADLRAAGTQVAGCAWEVEDRPHRALMLLTDGLAGDQQEIIRGVHEVVGAGVPLVGGCAGDSLKMRTTHQFFGAEVLTDAVVAAAIASDAPLGIGVRHGWRRVGEPMLVTKSSRNRVHMLDGKPALDAYLERLEPPLAARTDPAAFTQFALTHPLGLSRRSGEENVRFIGDTNFEDRSLGCIAEVPQRGMVWLMEGDEESVLRATDAACADALEPLHGAAPLGLFAFDCIARRGVLGEDGIQVEVNRVAASAGGAPVAGFYTYGEIARTHGVSGFHNQTLVVLAVA